MGKSHLFFFWFIFFNLIWIIDPFENLWKAVDLFCRKNACVCVVTGFLHVTLGDFWFRIATMRREGREGHSCLREQCDKGTESGKGPALVRSEMRVYPGG